MSLHRENIRRHTLRHSSLYRPRISRNRAVASWLAIVLLGYLFVEILTAYVRKGL